MMGISEGLSRMRWKLSRTVLRGGATGNGGSLLGEAVDGRKKPLYVKMKEDTPMLLAGIWDRWKTPEGNIIESCTILTTPSNEMIHPLHDRMPLILDVASSDLWLDPKVTDPERLKPFFIPYPSEKMEIYPVSDIVNSPKNDTPECILPLA